MNQNYPNLEYMIFDGGSTDGTVEIIKKYQDKLAYWVSEPDKGLYDAVQKGFDKASGEILAWINSDDYYSESCFEIVSELFTKFENVEWLTGLSVNYNENDWIVHAASSRDFTRADLLLGDFKWIQQESTFWRKSLWDKAGGKLGPYKLADDFELWLRFSRYAKLYCVNCYLGGFRLRKKGQLSVEGMDKYLAECDDAIKNEPVSKADRKILRKLKILRFFLKILKKTKIFNANIAGWFIRRLYRKNYGNRRILFNREKNDFFIN